jgi:hypothetical protein
MLHKSVCHKALSDCRAEREATFCSSPNGHYLSYVSQTAQLIVKLFSASFLNVNYFATSERVCLSGVTTGGVGGKIPRVQSRWGPTGAPSLGT